MEITTEVLTWGSIGLILMFAEFIIPGGIVVFLGLAAVLVSASLQLGIIDSWVHAFTLWFVLALSLLLIFRNVGQKLVGGDSSIGNTDEELDVYGSEVEVIETIGPGNRQGRIIFQGSSWSALGDGSEIEAGAKAKIICRENISFVVEKIG